MSIKTAAISFGYVESNSTAWLLFQVETKLPATRREALQSLAEYLYQKMVIEVEDGAKTSDLYKDHMGKCCRRAWSERDRNNSPTHCPKCGADYSIPSDHTITVDDWHDYLWGLMRSDCDNYGEHDCVPNPYGWTPWMHGFDALRHETVIVSENGEHLLTLALQEVHPGLWKDNSEESYLDQDYQWLCNESCVFRDGSYQHLDELNELVRIDETTVKLQRATHRIVATTTYDYPSGAQAVVKDDQFVRIQYNTGDQVWFRDGKVIGVLAADGVKWGETTNSGQVQSG